MSKNLFEIAELCLQRRDINEKLTLTHSAWALYQAGELDFTQTKPVSDMGLVCFPEKPELLPARLMPKRKFGTPEGIAAFFHAIAHVEFMAIYLAWDIVYRFRGLPNQFYVDWLKVADEEATHFAMITEHLRQHWHMEYGDLPAHGGLWDHAKETAHDVLARLALIPRCMEARGLDVTPSIIEKFKQLNDAESVALLNRILTDELGHVERGSYWFNYFCQERALNPEQTYRDCLKQYYTGGKPKGPFNREMRIMAGFTTAELDWLETPL